MDDNVGLILTKRAHLNPELEALYDSSSGRRLTFAALNESCNRTPAHALAARGIGKGDRVAILTLNCPEFIETFFALAKLGAVVVPLNVRLVARELIYILGDSGARTLVYGEEFRATVREIHASDDDALSVSDWIQVVEPGGDRDEFALDYQALQAAGCRRTNPSSAGPRTTCSTSCTPRARPGCRRASCTPTTPRSGRLSISP